MKPGLNRLIRAALAGLALGMAGSARAQAPEPDAEVERFRALITGLDSAALRQWERRLGEEAQTPGAELLRRLQRGFVRLALGRTGDGWSYGRAARDFRRAAELAPGWALPWYACGLAHRAEADWHAANRLNLGTRVGFGALEQALDDFARALAADPASYPAIRDLYQVAVLLRDTTRLATVVLPALRAAAAAGADDPGLYLSLGRAERRMGDPAAAVTAFRRYLALGGTPGLGLRELAWSAFVAGDPVGDSAYYAGAALDDSAGVAGYREDLALIADDTTLAGFDSSSGPLRSALLRRLWTDRDRQALRAPGERLREHYRRLSYAERYYSLEVNRRYFADTDMFRSGSSRFDDRGMVYIRYGEPSDRALTRTWGIQPNETWVYRRADGDLLLHFAANTGGDIHDLRLIPSVMQVGGVDPGNGDNAATFFALKDRCRLYQPYCKYQGWGTFGQRKILTAERAVVRASVSWAVSTDGYDLRFARGLAAAAEAFAVGEAEGGRSLVHVAYQVRVRAPDSLPENVAFRVPLRVRVSLFDARGHNAAWADTTTEIHLPGGGPVGATLDLVGRVTVPAPPGAWLYRAALSYDDSTGTVLPTDSVRVGRFDGSRLAVSDLVLSRHGRGAPWSPAPGDTAFFNPRRVWSRTDTLSLYHEIYGLPANTPYRARLLLRRGKRRVLTLTWEGQSAGEVTRVDRTVSFERVGRGDYEMEVEISGPDGAKATAARSLRLE
jgi:GWxTD domain-containing protein